MNLNLYKTGDEPLEISGTQSVRIRNSVSITCWRGIILPQSTCTTELQWRRQRSKKFHTSICIIGLVCAKNSKLHLYMWTVVNVFMFWNCVLFLLLGKFHRNLAFSKIEYFISNLQLTYLYIRDLRFSSEIKLNFINIQSCPWDLFLSYLIENTGIRKIPSHTASGAISWWMVELRIA